MNDRDLWIRLTIHYGLNGENSSVIMNSLSVAERSASAKLNQLTLAKTLEYSSMNGTARLNAKPLLRRVKNYAAKGTCVIE